MENHRFQWVNPLFLWPCSIATVSLPEGICSSMFAHHPPSHVHVRQDLVMIEEAVLALSQPGEQFTKAWMGVVVTRNCLFFWLRKGPEFSRNMWRNMEEYVFFQISRCFLDGFLHVFYILSCGFVSRVRYLSDFRESNGF